MDKIKAQVIIGTNPESVNAEGLLSDFSLSELNEKNFTVFPAFCDVHVHLREPGFSNKETIYTGTKACAHGGYSAVCSMPNLMPVPDSEENLKVQTDIIDKDACISVYPYGAITKGERGEYLSDMDKLSGKVIAFSDDGRGVQSEEMMEQAMRKAKSLDKIIVAHCEVNSLLNGGYIHDGKYAKEHNHKGISSASEYLQIGRDIILAKITGAKYHVCHISTKESVDLIRKAKQTGVDITCETAPHYLVLTDSDIKENGNYKMNPPLRDEEDRKALIEGLIDGTIDMIATDHAPHTEEEKSRGLEKSPFGIVGIETAFSVLYTELVKKGIISIEKLIDLIAVNPRKRFNIPFDGYTVWDLNEKYVIDGKDFLSKGKSTPFIGKEVYGVNYLTKTKKGIVYKK